MRVINGYVIINKIEERKMVGGLDTTLASSKTDRYGKGVLTHLSPEAAPLMKRGETVTYTKGRSFTLNIKGEEKTVVRIGDIVAIE